MDLIASEIENGKSLLIDEKENTIDTVDEKESKSLKNKSTPQPNEDTHIVAPNDVDNTGTDIKIKSKKEKEKESCNQ